MIEGIRRAEQYRQTAFITQVGPNKFVSCWMGDVLGVGHKGDVVRGKTALFLKNKGIAKPVLITIGLNGKRHMEVAK